MAKLENKIIKKLEEEGRISNMPLEEAQDISLKEGEKMKQYNIIFMRRMGASYILARELILDSYHKS